MFVTLILYSLINLLSITVTSTASTIPVATDVVRSSAYVCSGELVVRHTGTTVLLSAGAITVAPASSATAMKAVF